MKTKQKKNEKDVNTVEKDSINNSPIVFVNKPIKSTKDDVVGFDNQVNTICTAIENGSNMIGVIADYGTGKSTMTELLSEAVTETPYNYPDPIHINMWDSFEDYGEEETRKQEVSDLTKSFVYQLANGKNDKGRFSKYINKRLSKNYGNVSFSLSSCRFWRFFVGAVLFYIIYAIFSNTNLKTPLGFENGFILTIARWARAINPAFLIISIILLLLGIKKTTVVFSHWKMQNVRENEINDVFDAYSEVIKELIPSESKKQVIIIEDLDRIEDKAVIVGFLKEIYRFQNLSKESTEGFVFIISIKPEYSLDNSNDTNNGVYSKLFDIIVPLKPIHFDDYDSVLIHLINSEPEKKKQLEKLLEEKIPEKSLPESFYWIKKGNNLTLRDLKDRLNQAILILSTRKSYKTRTAVSFEACAAVTYLENTYPKDYEKLISNEEAFSHVMSKSVSIIEGSSSKDAAIEKIKEAISSEYNISFINSNFINELCELIYDGTFNYDFRMYFYTYPQGSHIKTTEERRLCDYLLYPSRNNDFSNIDDLVKVVYPSKEDGKVDIENIVSETLYSLEQYPEVILHNDILFDTACNKDFKKALNTLKLLLLDKSKSEEDKTEVFIRIRSSSFDNKDVFVSLVIEFIINLYNSDRDLALKLRKNAVAANKEEPIAFKDLFVNNEETPQITSDEIDLINYPELSLPLINIEALNEDNYSYVSKLVLIKRFEGESFEIALEIVRGYMIVKPEGYEIFVIEFMTKNEYTDFNMFNAIFLNCDAERISEYINRIRPSRLTNEYYEVLEENDYTDGFSNEIMADMANNKYYHALIKYSAEKNDYTILDDFLDDKKYILVSCEWLNENFPDLFYQLRWHIVFELSRSDYSELFFNPFPLICPDELDAVTDTSSAIELINPDGIDENNYVELIEAINSRQYNENEIVSLFGQLFDPEVSDSTIPSQEELYTHIVQELDYQSIGIKKLYEENREYIYDLIKAGFDKAGKDSFERIRILGCLIPSVEEQIYNDYPKEYQELVSEIDEFTSATEEWMSNNYLVIPLSEKLTKKLKAKGDLHNYIISSVLREGKMILDSKIPIDVYLEVYENVPEVFGIMSDHWDFLESIAAEDYLETLYSSKRGKELIYPFDKVHQNNQLLKYVFSTRFTDDEKMNYMLKVKNFADDNVVRNYLRIITTPQYLDLINSKNKYEHIHENLPKNYKATFTRRWNRYFKKNPKALFKVS